MQLITLAGAGGFMFVLAFATLRSQKRTITSEPIQVTPLAAANKESQLRFLRRRSITLTSLSQTRSAVEKHPARSAAGPKPKLIIHIGPMKTSTTSLQYDLTHMTEKLEMDQYTYQGRQYDPFYNDQGMFEANRTLPLLLQEARNMFQHCTLVPRRLCCDNLLRQLNVYKNKGDNVILSDESLNRVWRTPEEYRAVKEALQDDWDTTIVIGYRRFYEWIVSFKTQQDRWIQQHVTEDDHPILPLFAYLDVNQWAFPFSDRAMANARDSFSVQVLSLYDDGDNHRNDSTMSTSMRSKFLCNILKGATASCQHSLKRDRVEQEFRWSNAVSRTTHQNEHHRQPHQTYFYDALVTSAISQGLFDTTAIEFNNRRELAAAIQQYHLVDLARKQLDFELKCPSATELERILHFSLQLEAKILSEDSAMDMEEDHVAGFHAMVARKEFCWVDTKRVLKQREWQEFFANLKSVSLAS